MALVNRYVVLYWTKGAMPSDEQLAEARYFGPHVRYRNSLHHSVGSGLEPCTAVAGEVPPDYAKAYPYAVSYADWLDGKLETKALPVPVQPTDPDADGSVDIATMLGARRPSRAKPQRVTASLPRQDGPGVPAGAGLAFELPPPPPGVEGAPPPPPGAPPPPDGDDWKPQG